MLTPAVLPVPRRLIATPPLPRQSATVVVLDTWTALAAHVQAWEELAAAALEPNVFFEPWMLLPAVRSFGRGVNIRFVLVYVSEGDGERKLAGLFPLERRRGYRGVPLTWHRLWLHRHGYLGTPLLRVGAARVAMTALLDWLAANGTLCELPLVAADGPFAKLLAAVCGERGPAPLITGRHARGLLRCGQDADRYLRESLSGSTRRALERRQRRLAEAGRLTVETGADDVPPTRWVEEFLGLEASGWKGRRGTALVCRGDDTLYFRSVAHAAAERGRLIRLALRVDGRTIASRCAFRAGDGAFAFKSAYDERHAGHSPGALLELSNIRQCHADGIGWMDSCTSPANDLINRLWQDRRVMQTLTIPTSGRGERVLRVLRWLQQRRRARRGTISETGTGSQETLP